MPTLLTRKPARLAARSVALGAVAGPILFTLCWFVLGFVSPGYTMWGSRIAPYSVISQSLSGLGLGPTGPYMNAAFILSGLLILAGAVGVFRSISELGPAARWIATALLALPGLGAMVDGVFTLEHFFLHFVGFGLALTTVTLALTALYFATFTPTIQGVQHGVAGLTERVLVLELQAWYVAIGWLAFTKSKAAEAHAAVA